MVFTQEIIYLNQRMGLMNLDKFKSIATHQRALHVNDNKVIYSDSFGVQHIPKEIKKFTRNKNIIIYIYFIQAYNPIMCGYFCIGFIDFMLKGKSLLDYTSLFFPNMKRMTMMKRL